MAFLSLHVHGKTASRVETTLKIVKRAARLIDTVKLDVKEHFNKEHICVKEPFPVTKRQFTS